MSLLILSHRVNPFTTGTHFYTPYTADSQFVMFDTRSSENLDTSALLKVELDDSLKMLGRAHAAVIHNIESIPGPAAMILHAYCDNENAPFKQVG